MTDAEHAHHAAIRELAAAHGLELDPDSLEVNEMGLDYRVALARATSGADWVLRIPRRAGLTAGAEVEARILGLVAPHLTAAVPDWRIRTEQLIAYPLLPGSPGLTLDPIGSPVWHVDVASPRYAADLGDLLAELHAIDPDEARAAGIPTRTPEEIREGWRRDIARVDAEFDVAPALVERWTAWVEEDSFWPTWSVLTHGELYAAHTLVDEEDGIVGVLDWTTAAVGDPGRDFMLHHASAPAELFQVTVDRYVERGGTVWPRLADHCAELFAANPLGHGLYALETGVEDHRDAAQAALNPEAAG